MDNNKNLGWFVWFEVKINELAMSVKAGLMIVFLALLIQVASVILLWIFDFIHFHNEANSFAVIKLFFQNFPQDCKKRSHPATHDVLIRPAKTVASDH